jgi:deazaflavin-dependent oxidoreductase (nitroreductase family)
VSAYAEANPLQRALRSFAASGPGSRLLAPVLNRVDRAVYRATRGRHTLSSLTSGLPVVLLTTTGARSGRPSTVALLGLPTPDGLGLIASNYGRPKHPAWCHTLRADPAAEIAVDGARTRVRAVEVEGEQRARIWEQALKSYPGYSGYERRAGDRRIAVFVLEPVTTGTAAAGGAGAAPARPRT